MGYTWLNDKHKCYNFVTPFPCLEKQNTGPSCSADGLVNVVDVVMGQNGVIWALDTGISETLSDHPSRECHAKIFGLDASTGKVNGSAGREEFGVSFSRDPFAEPSVYENTDIFRER